MHAYALGSASVPVPVDLIGASSAGLVVCAVGELISGGATFFVALESATTITESAVRQLLTDRIGDLQIDRVLIGDAAATPESQFQLPPVCHLVPYRYVAFGSLTGPQPTAVSALLSTLVALCGPAGVAASTDGHGAWLVEATAETEPVIDQAVTAIEAAGAAEVAVYQAAPDSVRRLGA